VEHNLPDQTKNWEGFRPTAYSLDVNRVCALPLERVAEASTGQHQTIPVTVGEVYRSLAEQVVRVESIPPILVATAKTEVVFDGPHFNCHLLQVLLDLRKDGFDGFCAKWYWYESDSLTDEVGHSYRFFVVDKDRIVRESVSFTDAQGSGFNPSVFTRSEVSPPRSVRYGEWEKADTRFWYRKFYQETRMGQLMMLRNDEPELYHYGEGRWRPELTLYLVYRRMSSIRWAVWTMVLLMVLLLGILLWSR